MTAAVSRSILVVDDDISVGQTIAEAVRLAGHRCDVAIDVQQAFARLSQPHTFDVVFLDLQLGEERSEDLVQRLAQSGVALPPFVIVSGRPNAELRVAGRVTQAAAWLKKPISLGSVEAAIDIALNPDFRASPPP